MIFIRKSLRKIDVLTPLSNEYILFDFEVKIIPKVKVNNSFAWNKCFLKLIYYWAGLPDKIDRHVTKPSVLCWSSTDVKIG